MIYLEQGEINKVILTLSEVSTLVNPYYLFVFTNEMDTTSVPVLFTTLDTSAYTERYNLFLIDEPTDLTLTKGQYVYEVYESLIIPVTIEDTTGIVIEEGRMVVSGPVINTIYS
jgi:hypothetical protein